jgi:hypothetical protein
VFPLNAVGVPLIVQLLEILKPEGSVGLALHDVTAPPVLVTETAVIATFL